MSWISQAACKDSDPVIFTSFDPVDIDQAKSICKHCPVKKPCIMQHYESNVIAGEMTKYDRLLKMWKRVEEDGDSNWREPSVLV